MQDGMTIGRLAKAVGEHVETIRYYQRRGLIDEPRKPASGHRRYPGDVVNRIRFIRRAQQMGFSLEEVKSLLKLSDGKHGREVRQIAERKQELLEARISQLTGMRTQLKDLIDESKRRGGRGACPIIAALTEDEPTPR
jgi:MerR family mercuric resistance operon transcriptional regulator